MNLLNFRLPVPDEPPDAGSLIFVNFGADWIPIILSALEVLRDKDYWYSPPDDIIPQIDELMNRIANTVTLSPQVFPKTALHFHKFSTINFGNALLLVNSSAWDFASVWLQYTSAINDTFSFQFFMVGGSWNINFHGQKSTSGGIISVVIDNVYIGSLDFYSAATVQNAVLSLSASGMSDGQHLFVCNVTGKNASAVNYNIALTAVSISST